ncbi:MAG TPA: PQQ-dependent sugar dehydrogenase [Casimicrobiaceae bacterium]|jgi:hypothetical protein
MIFALVAWTLMAPLALAQRDLPLDRLHVPPGFVIDVVARVDGARAMAWGKEGTLFVGSNGSSVYAVRWPGDGMSLADARVTRIGSGLKAPIGVAFRDGALYASSVDRIVRFDAIEAHLDAPPPGVAVVRDLPGEMHHGGRYIAFGPDGKLYANIGAPCNICEPDAMHGLILRMNVDGSGREVVARGVRNSVGFDWQPGTGDLWFTDNGRDNLGDDVPPDELDHAVRSGDHFGYPYCHAGTVADPEFGAKHPCSEFVPPARALGAHVAPLGMRFYTGTQFPTAYRDQVFIAEHGSWNRAHKVGYRVSLVTLDARGRATDYRVFADGWLQGESSWGRPVDVLVAPDGSLLVSDDTAGAIYRIRYTGT